MHTSTATFDLCPVQVVVFSSWVDVLELLAHALDTNSVGYAWAKARRGFQAALHVFKHGGGIAAGGAQGAVQVQGVEAGGEEREGCEEQVQAVGEADAMVVDGQGGLQGDEQGFAQDAQDPAPPTAAQAKDEARGGAQDLKPVLRPAGLQPAAAAPPNVELGIGEAPGTAAAGPAEAAAAAAISGKRTAIGPLAVGSPPKRRRKGVGARSRLGRNQALLGGDKAGPGQYRGHEAGSGAQGVAPRVLLLLVSQGGAGLNIIEAQHVLLVEPLLEPAVEQQAIGRVHRIGQVRCCGAGGSLQIACLAVVMIGHAGLIPAKGAGDGLGICSWMYYVLSACCCVIHWLLDRLHACRFHVRCE